MSAKTLQTQNEIVRWLLGGLALLAMVPLTGCGKDDTASVKESSEAAPAETFPVFQEASLIQGRNTFVTRCKFCHEIGREDAPIAGRREHWEQRLSQGRETLLRHAIQGFESPSGGEMPARGGHADLTDEEVKAAVDYMIKIIQ